MKKLFVLTALLLAIIPLEARVHRQMHRDGTVEFTNIPERGKAPRGNAGLNLSPRFDDIIEAVSSREKADPLLIKCIVKVESDFNPRAVSPAGAMGLMQLMQEVADIYRVRDPFDPEENISAGVKHFKALLRHFNNDIPLSLAAYHAGPGRVRKHMSIPPIKSTINYVNRIMGIYNGLLGKEGGNYEQEVRRLYMTIDREGTIHIRD